MAVCFVHVHVRVELVEWFAAVSEILLRVTTMGLHACPVECRRVGGWMDG